MAVYNTQAGYRPPRTPGMATPRPAIRPATGLTRALSGVGSTYTNPYSAGVQLPPDERTGLTAGPLTTPTLPTVATPPPGTPSQYTPQPPVVPQAPTGYQFDLTTDPVLQQIMAAADQSRANAEANALAQQKQLAIQYGDKQYGSSIDQSTGQAAEQNPYSVYANLASQYAQGSHNLDENLNAHNLFYGGERIRELAQALSDYQRQQAQAAAGEQQGLGNISANRIAALMGADQSVQQGYGDAYTRALAWALAHPTAPATTGTAGTTSGTTTGIPSTPAPTIGGGALPAGYASNLIPFLPPSPAGINPNQIPNALLSQLGR